MLRRFVTELFSVFFRWWWAAITGVFTLLGAIAVPTAGITLGRYEVAGALFLFSFTLFLTLSVVAVAWRWYARIESRPVVRDLIPEQPNRAPMTIVVEPGTEPLPAGSQLALYRITELGAEACVAVLEVTTERKDGLGLQAEARWISSMHKAPLQRGNVRKDDLRLRPIHGDAIALVVRCLQETR